MAIGEMDVGDTAVSQRWVGTLGWGHGGHRGVLVAIGDVGMEDTGVSQRWVGTLEWGQRGGVSW